MLEVVQPRSLILTGPSRSSTAKARRSRKSRSPVSEPRRVFVGEIGVMSRTEIEPAYQLSPAREAGSSNGQKSGPNCALDEPYRRSRARSATDGLRIRLAARGRRLEPVARYASSVPVR